MGANNECGSDIIRKLFFEFFKTYGLVNAATFDLYGNQCLPFSQNLIALLPSFISPIKQLIVIVLRPVGQTRTDRLLINDTAPAQIHTCFVKRECSEPVAERIVEHLHFGDRLFPLLLSMESSSEELVLSSTC